MKNENTSTQTLWSPMHTDGWALYLASCYVGAPLRTDAAEDAQSLFPGRLLGFKQPVIPSWAITHGESGPRTVVQMELAESCIEDHGAYCVATAPQRLTRVRSAQFFSEEELQNFIATYAAFDDVPLSFVPHEIGRIEQQHDTQIPKSITAPPHDWQAKRRALEFFGGWAAGVIRVSKEFGFADQLAKHSADEVKTPLALAVSLLNHMDSKPSALDKAIWGTTVDVVSELAASRGFDRLSTLEEIALRLSKKRVDKKGKTAWLSKCAAVLESRSDPPPLDDSGRVGQRAALALLIAHDHEAASNLRSALGAGDRVSLLVTVAGWAFQGLSRIPPDFKTDALLLNQILSAAESVAAGRASYLLSSKGGQPAKKTATKKPKPRSRSKPPQETSRELPESARLIIEARALESGIDLTTDGRTGAVTLTSTARGSAAVVVEADTSSPTEKPAVRFVMEIPASGFQSEEHLLELLSLAWTTGCAVGRREGKLASSFYAFVVQPPSTLDRDEFTFHLERLLDFRSKVDALLDRGRSANEPTSVRQPGKELPAKKPKPSSSRH